MNIISIGDSLTEGYVTKDVRYFYPYTTHLRKMDGIAKLKNIGMSGFTSSQIYNHLKKQNLRPGFDVAIVLSGTNDLLGKDEKCMLETNVKICSYLLDGSGSSGTIKHVYMLSLPQIISATTNKPLREKKRLRFNKMLNRWCGSSVSVTYIPFGEYFMYSTDISSHISVREYGRSEHWAQNGYHLSKEGYKMMAQFIYGFLKI